MNKLSERLKTLRKNKKLSQQEIANKLDVSRVAYTNWENGNREPNLDKITQLAFYLDTTIDFLLGKSDINYYDDTEIDSETDIDYGREVSEDETEAEEISRDIKYQFKKWLENILAEQSSSPLDHNPIENRIAYLKEAKQTINTEFKLQENNNFFDEVIDNAIQEWERFLPTFGNNLETTHSKSDKTDDNEKY